MAKTARGCPKCGSHNTWGLGRSGIQACDVCDYRWQPCGDQYCRGYKVFLEPSPGLVGCPDCDKDHGGVPTSIVVWWPEAWRAIARGLEKRESSTDGHSFETATPAE
jgi:hypothetical protein